MEFMEAVLKRRSYRGQFIDKPISQKDLDIIVEAARWSPSPFNIQPWEILIVTHQGSKDSLADLMRGSMASQMADGRFLQDVSRWMNLSKDEWSRRGEGVMIDDHIDVPDFIKDKTKLRPLLKNAKNMSFLGKLGLGKIGAAKFVELVRESPLIIIILMNTQKRSPGENRSTWVLLGMGAFMENILLAATSLNIGTHFINAPLETQRDREKIRQIFSIPDNYEPVCLLRAGYLLREGEAPAEPLTSVRLKPARFVHYEQFKDLEDGKD
jgi:nitroreductase